MTRIRKVVLVLFGLLMMVFAINSLLDFHHQTVLASTESKQIPLSPEQKILHLNKELSVLEKEEIRLQRKREKEEHTINYSRLKQRIITNNIQNIEKGKQEILKKKKLLGLYQRPR